MTRPSERYTALVETGELSFDPAQAAGAAALDQIFDALTTPARRRWWQVGRRQLAAAPSLYLHGPVGRGKTRLMDLFVTAIQDYQTQAQMQASQIQAPQVQDQQTGVERVHFHAFMLGIHQRIHALQQAGARGDPMPTLAQEIAARTPLLCFDEFVVNNIADAMILGRLFAALWDQGLTLIATSNFAPDDLYRDGLHRARFLPFIDMMKQHMQIVHVAGAHDYRTLHTGIAQVFFSPLNRQTRVGFEDTYKRLSLDQMGRPHTLQVGNRTLALPWVGSQIAMARFADLCEKPLGAADYLALTREFRAIALDEVPKLTLDLRNEASRFRVLIDTVYEAGMLLILRSAVPVQQLYADAKNPENARVLSRLSEMQGQTYVDRALARLDPDASAP